MNHKSKAEQVFVLAALCISFFFVFCLIGCGSGNGGEIVEYGIKGKSVGISIPGCGGCLTNGKGCNSCLWPQSCKVLSGCEETYTDAGTDKVLACDIKYYGSGCLGCGQKEKSCYSGCFDMKSIGLNGCVYGSTDSKEKVIGCYNGCGGCVGSGGIGGSVIDNMEDSLGIR